MHLNFLSAHSHNQKKNIQTLLSLHFSPSTPIKSQHVSPLSHAPTDNLHHYQLLWGDNILNFYNPDVQYVIVFMVQVHP